MAFLEKADMPSSGGGGGNDLSATQELVLVILEQLSISFDKLSTLDEAAPHLEKLMTIACRSSFR